LALDVLIFFRSHEHPQLGFESEGAEPEFVWQQR
jgi:hypothetical protein